MGRSKKQLKIQEPQQVEEQKEVVKEESVLVTFSGSINGRFSIGNNQAQVLPSELKENEKFVVKNGRTFIEVVEPTHTYLL